MVNRKPLKPLQIGPSMSKGNYNKEFDMQLWMHVTFDDMVHYRIGVQDYPPTSVWFLSKRNVTEKKLPAFPCVECRAVSNSYIK